jgi:adenylate cyclase
MTTQEVKRKLTAILSADVKGYSRLMGEDEESTARTLNTYKEVMAGLIQHHHGRVVDAPGDNVLAEFASVVDAVRCAVEIQKELKTRNVELPENRRMEFRIGVNLGDVIEGGDNKILGDGVNIAARMESLSEAGGICISGTAYDQVENKLSVGYEYLGEQAVKNIAKPVRVYRVLMEPEAAGKVIGEKKAKPRQWQMATMGLVIGVIVVVATIVIWKLYTPSAPQPEVVSKEKIIAPSPEKPLAEVPAKEKMAVEVVPKERIKSPPPEKVSKTVTPPPKEEVASKEKLALSLLDKPSIAVLPFTNMSGDPKEEYFSDGLTEQIISSLCTLHSLSVIARNSTFVYKGKAVKVQKVAEDLGARYVLEGSVQKSGDRVRVTAQLIDAITGHHIWSEHYDRELKDIFALQDEMTLKILYAMKIKLTEGEQVRHWVKWGSNNLKATEKNFQAVASLRRFTKQDNYLARQFAEEAIVLDPNYIWPYVNVGWTHFYDARFGWSESPAESLQRAFEFAQKALVMDDSIDSGHSLLGVIYGVKRQYEKAIAEAERAVALSPNGADAYNFLAGVVGMSGRWKESVLYSKKSIQLNPFPPIGYYLLLGRAYFMTGQYDESIATWKKALQANPDYLLAHVFLAACYSSLGRDAEASASAKEVLRIDPKFSIESYAKTLPYKDKADIEREVAALRKAGLK